MADVARAWRGRGAGVARALSGSPGGVALISLGEGDKTFFLWGEGFAGHVPTPKIVYPPKEINATPPAEFPWGDRLCRIM